ncbi:MAG: hypothetical protein C0408_09365 [Odoribacter sp.]|nr:hypothetical protein [Odoribacter sp.]
MMKELRDISNKSPFRVPENYFEEVNRKIISSTAGHSTGKTEKSLYRKLRPFLAVAASVTVLLVLSYTAIQIFPSGKDKPVFPVITLIEFSDHYLNDIDILTLEESTVSIEPDIAGIDINSKDIIDYLVLENIDINDIYEKL